MSDAPRRGGKREGAGRKRAPEPKEQRDITLSPRAWAFVALFKLQVGAKNDSQAIEHIIRSHILFVPETPGQN